jgi:DNA-binding transcriptional LysR family regulator
VDGLETRELRYFVAVAEELHFGRAAERLTMAQPPLSRAIQQLERRLGVLLLERDRRGVALTSAGETMLTEARHALDAVDAAVRRTRRAAAAQPALVLTTKAGASHELLKQLLDAYAARPGAVDIDVLLCEIGEQGQFLRDGRADVAIMHAPFDVMTGLDSAEILTEGQVAIVPAAHPLARRSSLTMAEVSDVPDLPIARWPRHDYTYPPGPGPEVRSQSQLAQLVALGRTLLVIPASSRAWQWPEHVAVPVLDAPLATTLLAWPAGTRSEALAGLVETAQQLKLGGAGGPVAIADHEFAG